jgi:hypothetical protein
VILFERSGRRGEVAGHVARYTGGDAAGIERQRVDPDGPQAIADERCIEVFQLDAVSARIGEGNISLTGARKVGEKFDGIAHINDDQKGRPAIGSGQRLGVLFGLVSCAEHGLIPSGGPTRGGSAAVRHFEE